MEESIFPGGEKTTINPLPNPADEQFKSGDANIISKAFTGVETAETNELHFDVKSRYQLNATQTAQIDITANLLTFNSTGINSEYRFTRTLNGDPITFDSNFNIKPIRNDYESLDPGVYDFWFVVCADGKIRWSITNVSLTPSYIPVWTIDEELGIAIPISNNLTIVDEFEVFTICDGTIVSNSVMFGWGDLDNTAFIDTSGNFRVKIDTNLVLNISSVFTPAVFEPARIFNVYYSKSLDICELLVDNLSVGSSSAIAGPFDKTSTDMFIGSRDLVPNELWNGDIFSVRVFDRKLSVTERNAQYLELLSIKP